VARAGIAAVVEAHDDEAEAYEKCRQVLASTPDVSGVYVSTANSIPVMRALDEQGLSGSITDITTDLFPAMAPLIESGRTAATIYQRPWVEGQIAFQAICKFLSPGWERSPRKRCVRASRRDLRLDPRFPQGHYQLGTTLEKKGRSVEAVKELEEAARLDASYPEPHYALARLYRRGGNAGEADRALERFLMLTKQKKEKPTSR
jgi:tetratricopeptide (TPR) repeat protein